MNIIQRVIKMNNEEVSGVENDVKYLGSVGWYDKHV